MSLSLSACLMFYSRCVCVCGLFLCVYGCLSVRGMYACAFLPT